MTSATRTAYSSPQRMLHWITALFVFATIPLGIAMVNARPGPTQNMLYELHWSCGFVILALTVIRLAARFANPPAPLPASVPAASAKMAHVVHILLYVLLIGMPIGGWIGKSAFGGDIYVFWLVPIPRIWGDAPDFGKRILQMHFAGGLLMTLLLLGHIGAALFHGIVKKDGVLQRMTRG
jgi:cytochrome b561